MGTYGRKLYARRINTLCNQIQDPLSKNKTLDRVYQGFGLFLRVVLKQNLFHVLLFTLLRARFFEQNEIGRKCSTKILSLTFSALFVFVLCLFIPLPLSIKKWSEARKLYKSSIIAYFEDHFADANSTKDVCNSTSNNFEDKQFKKNV